MRASRHASARRDAGNLFRFRMCRSCSLLPSTRAGQGRRCLGSRRTGSSRRFFLTQALGSALVHRPPQVVTEEVAISQAKHARIQMRQQVSRQSRLALATSADGHAHVGVGGSGLGQRHHPHLGIRAPRASQMARTGERSLVGGGIGLVQMQTIDRHHPPAAEIPRVPVALASQGPGRGTEITPGAAPVPVAVIEPLLGVC